MIRVKESLAYLAEFIQVATCNLCRQISISPETLRRSKLNEAGVVKDMRKLICDLIGVAEGFQMKEDLPESAYKDTLNLYLSLNSNPFVMEIHGEYYLDLDSSRELLKILCWLLFSNKKLLTILDKELVKSFCEIKIDDLSKDDKTQNKSPEKSKLQQIEDLNELIQLKTIFFLKLDAVNSLQEHHEKKLGKLLGSLHSAAQDKSKGDSGLSSMSPGSLLSLLSNKTALDNLTRQQSQASKLIDQVGQRSTVLEWMAHAVVEERQEKNQQISSLDYPEAGELAQKCKNIRILELQEIYNDVTKKLELLSSVADKVRKFGEFWSTQCHRMSTNADYKKVIGSIVNRETTRLANKYKKKKETEDQEVNKQIDLFKVLVDLKSSGKHHQPETKLAKGKGKDHAQATIDKIHEEYDQFVGEVKDFLISQGIKTIQFSS